MPSKSKPSSAMTIDEEKLAETRLTNKLLTEICGLLQKLAYPPLMCEAVDMPLSDMRPGDITWVDGMPSSITRRRVEPERGDESPVIGFGSKDT